MNLTPQQELRFGRLTARPVQRQVLIDGRPLALGARALDVLMALIEHRTRLVTKEELLATAWRGLVVEENNLQVQISTLRKLIGANAIATIPAQGYRFTLPESPEPSDTADVSTARHNLPAQLTGFIGRTNELSELKGLLEQARLVTLTGIGGCGKTRLALQLAQEVLPAFSDGVRYVDLAAVQDEARVAGAVADVLNVAAQHDRPLVDLLGQQLRRQSLLLVLDNCEHLIPACVALIEPLLSTAPNLKVLAASREGLGLRGERLVAVRSLAFPAAGSAAPAQIAEFESVRLFVERAQALLPTFSLNQANALAVAEICRRLDGLPLAIELAAGRTSVLSVEEIRNRLDDRFRLLTGGRPAAMGRQQTLLAAVRWSHEQLTEEERGVLQRLSIFAGGWTLEAAMAVASEAGDEYEMLDVLARLAHHGLVVAQPGHDQVTRYAMLETVRQYALERLQEAGEASRAMDRHLAYYLALAQMDESKRFGPEQLQWDRRLASELDNFLGAHAWCNHSERGAQDGLLLLSALRPYLSEAGQYLLGERLLAEALGRPGAQTPNLARCAALAASGMHLFFLGRYAESQARAQESLAIATAIGERARQGYAMWIIGFCEFACGHSLEARARFERSLELARAEHDVRQIPRVLIGLAEIERTAGNLNRALELNEEVLAIHRQESNLLSALPPLANLATIALELGQNRKARDYLMQAVAVADRSEHTQARISQLSCAAGLAAANQDLQRSGRLLGAMNTLAESMNYHVEPADAVFVASLTDRVRQGLGDRGFADAIAMGRAATLDQALDDMRALLASDA